MQDNYETLNLQHRHLPIRAATKRELAILEQAVQAYPADLIIPEIRDAMQQRYPVVDDDELIILRKSQIPLGAWIGLCRHIPRGSIAQLAEDDEGPALVVERSILDMILDALSALIKAVLGMLTGEKNGPKAGKPTTNQGGRPNPGRSLLIEHDGPGF
jgi:hypothetical protein